MDLILYMMELVIGSLICGGLVLACDDLIPFKTRSSLGESWLLNGLKCPEVMCKLLTADRFLWSYGPNYAAPSA